MKCYSTHICIIQQQLRPDWLTSSSQLSCTSKHDALQAYLVNELLYGPHVAVEGGVVGHVSVAVAWHSWGSLWQVRGCSQSQLRECGRREPRLDLSA